MKTKKFVKKLVLNKKTIVNLGNGSMKAVYGGSIPNCPPPTLVLTNCWTRCVTNCPECPPDPTAETLGYSYCPETCFTCPDLCDPWPN